MTNAEFAAYLAAYIGAGAWLPQIAAWVYRFFVTPRLSIVPDRYAEVGFTSYGPIFNLRMAFACDRKDAIIDGFELVLRHSDGDTRTFRWAGLSETFSEIRDDAGNRQVVGRDQTPIALKIGTESLVEKFVRFQEPRYHESDRPALTALVAQFNFLKRTSAADYVTKVLSSKELFDSTGVRQKSFWWKPGRYSVTIKLSSPRKFTLTADEFVFELSSVEVDQLRQNVDALTTEIQNLIKSNVPEFKPDPVNWNWANVDIRAIGTT